MAKVSKIYVKAADGYNDLGLLKLSMPLTFGSRVQAVPLPTMKQYPKEGSYAYVQGWGS